MDIEGAEYGVLTSLEDYEIQDVDRWLIEFHENTNGEFLQIAERFQSLGFEVKVHNHTNQNTSPLKAIFILFKGKQRMLKWHMKKLWR